jgi:hypothetical protein
MSVHGSTRTSVDERSQSRLMTTGQSDVSSRHRAPAPGAPQKGRSLAHGDGYVPESRTHSASRRGQWSAVQVKRILDSGAVQAGGTDARLKKCRVITHTSKLREGLPALLFLREHNRQSLLQPPKRIPRYKISTGRAESRHIVGC